MNKKKMNEPAYNQAKEKSWVEPLSAEEAAELRQYLGEHPEMQRDWDEEAALTASLNRLPNVPVSTNFTSRVMQAVQRAEAEEQRKSSGWRAFWRRAWIPKLAFGAVALCLGTVSFHEYQLASRAKLANDVQQFAERAPMPQVDWLKDFDTINKMSQVQVADDELAMARQ